MTITIQTDDGEKLTGIIEGLTEWTVTIRQPDGIMYVPIAEVVDVKTGTEGCLF